MPQPAAPGGPGWLTVQEASERLDVHPATLRQWADRGRIRSFRTPGGHRRFSAEDVEAMLTALPPDLDLLLNAALGRARRDLVAGRLAGAPWYRVLDQGTRDRYRRLGRELLVLLVRSLAPGMDPADALAGARQAGREQARLAAQAGLNVGEAARAHAAFRDMLVESVLQMKAVQDQGPSAHDLVRSYRQVGAFLDEVLVACLDAFSETDR
jgi:excisionase family DNA binding protein